MEVNRKETVPVMSADQVIFKDEARWVVDPKKVLAKYERPQVSTGFIVCAKDREPVRVKELLDAMDLATQLAPCEVVRESDGEILAYRIPSTFDLAAIFRAGTPPQKRGQTNARKPSGGRYDF